MANAQLQIGDLLIKEKDFIDKNIVYFDGERFYELTGFRLKTLLEPLTTMIMTEWEAPPITEEEKAIRNQYGQVRYAIFEE